MQVVVRNGSGYLLYLLFCDSGHLKRVVAWVGFEVCAAGFACWAVSFGARGGAEQDRSRSHVGSTLRSKVAAENCCSWAQGQLM